MSITKTIADIHAASSMPALERTYYAAMKKHKGDAAAVWAAQEATLAAKEKLMQRPKRRNPARRVPAKKSALRTRAKSPAQFVWHKGVTDKLDARRKQLIGERQAANIEANRKKTTRNPAPKPVLLYTVQRAVKSVRAAPQWKTVAVFDARADAFEYAKAFAKGHNVRVRVVD